MIDRSHAAAHDSDMDLRELPAPLVRDIEAAWARTETDAFESAHYGCDFYARGYVAAKGERTLEDRAGAVVTFDDPSYDTELDGPATNRLVATCVPGGVDADGELTHLMWVDAWGSSFDFDDIEKGNPIVVA